MKKEEKGVMEQAEDPNDLVEVEVRLVPYSEHSSYAELCDFLRELKPVRVLPTVFGSESERRRMEKDFCRFCDKKEVGREFVKKMFGGGEKVKTKTETETETEEKQEVRVISVTFALKRCSKLVASLVAGKGNRDY